MSFIPSTTPTISSNVEAQIETLRESDIVEDMCFILANHVAEWTAPLSNNNFNVYWITFKDLSRTAGLYSNASTTTRTTSMWCALVCDGCWLMWFSNQTTQHGVTFLPNNLKLKDRRFKNCNVRIWVLWRVRQPATEQHQRLDQLFLYPCVCSDLHLYLRQNVRVGGVLIIAIRSHPWMNPHRPRKPIRKKNASPMYGIGASFIATLLLGISVMLALPRVRDTRKCNQSWSVSGWYLWARAMSFWHCRGVPYLNWIINA